MEQNVIIFLGWCEPIIERLLGLIALLVNELTTDLMLLDQVTDGRCPHKCLKTDIPTNIW